MTDNDEPYSRRDPYWGVDEYGRPLSCGRPSLYGPAEPGDSEEFADQLTYLQADPSQRPIDPAAVAAPSVLRPHWPASVPPIPPQAAERDDEQPTVWIDDEEQHTLGVQQQGAEQETIRVVPAPIDPDERVTVGAVPYPPLDPPVVQHPHLRPAGGEVEPIAPSFGPQGAAISYAGQTMPPQDRYDRGLEGPQRLASAPAKRQKGSSWWRRHGTVAVIVVAILLTAGALLGSRILPDGAKQDPGSQATGALSDAWRTSQARLTLDSLVVDGTLVTVECRTSDPAGESAGGAAEPEAGTIVRTQEDPATCALIGRSVGDGRSLWRLDRQPIGVALAPAGSAVVAYGGRAALVVSAGSGAIVRTFPHGVLLGASQAVAVIAERADGGSSRAVAIRVDDGRELWQAPIAPSLLEQDADDIRRAAISIPSGFADN
ncbi:MAG: hypothetical protein ACRDTD_27020, partial [Pseudonocardiaceae bacterium]